MRRSGWSTKVAAWCRRRRSTAHGRRFTLSTYAETHPVDYELGNWFTSAHPNSIFVNGLLGARAEPDRRYALFNNQLAIHSKSGGTEKKTLTSAGEIRDALTDLFKLRLDQLEGLDPALAALSRRKRMSRGRNGPRQPGGGRQQAGPRGRGQGRGQGRVATSETASARRNASKSGPIRANPICR